MKVLHDNFIYNHHALLTSGTRFYTGGILEAFIDQRPITDEEQGDFLALVFRADEAPQAGR